MFTAYYNLRSLPASVDTLCWFSQFLSNSFKASSSKQTYLNGVKFWHLFADKSVLAFDSFQLSITLKGIARSMKHVPRQAAPITLRMLTEFLEHLDLNKLKDVTFWALILIGFYCMLHTSNLVPDKIDAFDSRKQLCRVNIKINSHCLLIEIKWSKTIQFSQKLLLIPLLAVPGSSLCPVAAFSNMVKLVPGNPSDPAFMLSKGQAKVPVTYNQLQSKLKLLVQATGKDPNDFSYHSIRRGRATNAFKAQVPGELIKIQGDWSSEAYLRYLHVPLDFRL